MNVTIEYGIVGIPEHQIKVTHQLPPQYAVHRCDFADPVLVTSPAVDIIYHTVIANGCSMSNNVFVVKEPVQLLPKVKEAVSVVWCTMRGSVNIMYYDNLITLLQGQYSCFQLTGRQQPSVFGPGVYEIQHYSFPREMIAANEHHSKFVDRWLTKIDGEQPALLTPNAGIIWDKLYRKNHELKYTVVNSGVKKNGLVGELQSLLSIIIEHQDSNVSPTTSDHTFNTIKTFIKNNLDKELTISQLSAIYYISESKLRHSFTKYCGMSFSDYQLKIRMERARALCINENISIAHIAYIVGYKNPSALTKIYKSYYGETPSETRRAGGSD